MKAVDSALFEDNDSNYLGGKEKKGMGRKSNSFIQLTDMEKPHMDELHVVN